VDAIFTAPAQLRKTVLVDACIRTNFAPTRGMRATQWKDAGSGPEASACLPSRSTLQIGNGRRMGMQRAACCQASQELVGRLVGTNRKRPEARIDASDLKDPISAQDPHLSARILGSTLLTRRVATAGDHDGQKWIYWSNQ
jgi:hypothetical protein